MICKKCGADVADEMTFCTVCGEEMIPDEPQKKPALKGKKKLIAIVGAALAVVLVLVLLIVIFSGNAAEERVEDLYESILDYDLNAAVDALPPQVVRYYKDQLALENSELEIIDSRELKQSRVDELDARYAARYGTPEGYIEAVSEVEIALSYEDQEISRDPIKIYVVKVDGNWYIDLLMTYEELDEAELQPMLLPQLPSFP